MRALAILTATALAGCGVITQPGGDEVWEKLRGQNVLTWFGDVGDKCDATGQSTDHGCAYWMEGEGRRKAAEIFLKRGGVFDCIVIVTPDKAILEHELTRGCALKGEGYWRN